MKKLLFTISCVFVSLLTHASIKQDTTIVEFTDKSTKKRITVQSTGKKEFTLPQNLNLENLLNEIGVDSSDKKKALVILGQDGTKQDTILVLSKTGNKIQIITRTPESVAKRDSLHKNEGIAIEKENDADMQQTPPPPKDENIRYFSKNDFGLYVGLNNWQKNNAAAPHQLYSLRTWQSRYVALSFRSNATLVNTKGFDLAMSYGPEFQWYNFMFENNNMIENVNNQTQFVESVKSLDKSKLTASYINLPILLNFGFEKAKFNIGFGGYVGYRIGSHRKLRYDGGRKENERSSYNLNDFNYGLTAEMGKRKGATFFFRYDLQPLFKSNQMNAKDLAAWSVGLRL